MVNFKKPTITIVSNKEYYRHIVRSGYFWAEMKNYVSIVNTNISLIEGVPDGLNRRVSTEILVRTP